MTNMEDNLSPSVITDNLTTQFVGRRVLYYPKLASTMDVAKRQAYRGAVEGTVVFTGEQTAGRGRIKRVWLSPRGSIALSLILRPDMTHLPSLMMLASLAVVRSIEMVTGLKSQIKWPNDVLLRGKKVAGILIENDWQGDSLRSAIIGIGINVNLRTADFPEIKSLATSLYDELGREVSQLALVRQWLVEVERLYLTRLAGGAIYEDWRDNLVTLGKPVRLTSERMTVEGIAESVARDGSLLLRLPDGRLTRVIAGDVTLRLM
ncbi:MAG: biotin--[acetyl-CoA-carboxylase] ligase [Dehalococcoidales bacterium]|nr:biotin--[acetyl-CoA-carboxylase] ligase [Dehalococcoidales bacterium]